MTSSDQPAPVELHSTEQPIDPKEIGLSSVVAQPLFEGHESMTSSEIGAAPPDLGMPEGIVTPLALQQERSESGASARGLPPPILPVIDVSNLDWSAVRSKTDPSAVRARIQIIVEGTESLLDREGGPALLFDSERSYAEDRALKVTALSTAPMWFIGDLHGDLLALEAALVLIEQEARQAEGSAPRIVFLGDLFDDEGFGLEVLLRIFELIVDGPQRICLIAGNHDEALSYDGVRFTSQVNPSDFSDFLNANLAHEWIQRAGKLAVRIFATAPRALFFDDGLLATHGGFPLCDLHSKLAETADWNDPACLSDFVWTRAHPSARKKLPNRYSRGSQFGYEDFAAFCRVSTELGRPITHLVRGHDHVENRYAFYPAYRDHPLLTTVALSRRLSRDNFGPYERAPSLARYVEGSVPQVYSLRIPGEIIREIYPEAMAADADASSQGEVQK